MLYTDDTGECKVGKIKGGSSAGPPEETIRVYISTTPTSTTMDCYTEENINYDQILAGTKGLNYGTPFITSNSEECRVLCRENYPEAEYFTWRTDNDRCKCKQSKGEVVEKSEYFSGNVKCTSTTPDCYTEENINYDVTLVGLQRLNHGIRFETPNSEKCRVYCSDNYPEAEFFTWRTDNKKCFCKQSKGVLKEISEVISGNVKCI